MLVVNILSFTLLRKSQNKLKMGDDKLILKILKETIILNIFFMDIVFQMKKKNKLMPNLAEIIV